jgi:hypothetical protein
LRVSICGSSLIYSWIFFISLIWFDYRQHFIQFSHFNSINFHVQGKKETKKNLQQFYNIHLEKLKNEENSWMKIFFQWPRNYYKENLLYPWDMFLNMKICVEEKKIQISHLEWLNKQSRNQHELEWNNWLLNLNQFLCDFHPSL